MKRYIRGIRKPALPRGIRIFLPALLAVGFVLITLRGCFLTQVSVSEQTAMPHTQSGDRILVNRTAYGWRLPFASRNGARHISPRAPSRNEWCVAELPSGSGKFRLLQITHIPGDTITAPARPGKGGKVLPPHTYASGPYLIRHADLVGRPVCVTYSVDSDAPLWQCLRTHRFLMPLP